MATPVAPIAASLPPGTSVGGLATLGKIAFALIVIVALIYLLAWLVRRMGPIAGSAGRHLKLIAVRAVGHRERVVILEVEGTWLVLGVTAGGITKLHELPAKPVSTPVAGPLGGTFARRFAAALRQNLGGGGQ